MKVFSHYIVLVAGVVFMLLSCNKEEQSCQDGVYSPEHETQTDCGGVCPPCDTGEDPVPQEFLYAKIEGVGNSFSNRNLTRSGDWVLNFQNDTISVTMNFGDGDSLGARSMKINNSGAIYNGEVHSTLAEGTVLFTEIDHTEDRLSGFFECKFVSDQNALDTLTVKNGDFQNIPW